MPPNCLLEEKDIICVFFLLAPHGVFFGPCDATFSCFFFIPRTVSMSIVHVLGML